MMVVKILNEFLAILLSGEFYARYLSNSYLYILVTVNITPIANGQRINKRVKVIITQETFTSVLIF